MMRNWGVNRCVRINLIFFFVDQSLKLSSDLYEFSSNLIDHVERAMFFAFRTVRNYFPCICVKRKEKEQ